MHPQPSEQDLVAYYNSAYRRSSYAQKIGDRWVDTPVNFEASIQSFQRFRNFYDTVERASRSYPDVVPQAGDTIVDFGGYQGAFLYAAAQVWGIRGIVLDYNRAGIEFAKSAFGFTDSIAVTDLTRQSVPGRARFATAVHSLEHFRNPREFLVHVREDVLTPGGYLYLEVPNALGSPLSNPTHFFMYTQDALTYLLHAAGFEVIDLSFTGFPREHLLVGNPIENIVCLARPTTHPTQIHPTTSRAHRAADIRKNYRTLSRRALRMTLRSALQANWTLAVRLLLVGIVDYLPATVAKKVRSAIISAPRLLRRENRN